MLYLVLKDATLSQPEKHLKYFIPGFFLHFNNFPSHLKWLSATSFTSYVFEGAMHAIYGFNRAKMVGGAVSQESLIRFPKNQ